jgi:hypothetical protein
MDSGIGAKFENNQHQLTDRKTRDFDQIYLICFDANSNKLQKMYGTDVS